MKKILISLSIIGVVGAAVIGFTIAYFNDTETSTGNIFVAGTMDLKVDHKYAMYNGKECTSECVENIDPSANLIQNGSFEIPEVTDPAKWQIFPSGTPGLGWTVEWADISANTYQTKTRPNPALVEYHNGVLGNAKDGDQYAELDSDWFGPNDPLNGEPALIQIHQDIPTTIGAKYRLHYYYAPRPNTAVGENILDVEIDDANVASHNLGGGGGSIAWVEYTVEFTADYATTKVEFIGGGINNSLGIFLDNVTLYPYICNYQVIGGNCKLWDFKDLTEGDYFWNFGDTKPGDWGTNVISLHVESNDAYICLLTNNEQNLENGLVDPEIALGDAGEPGELSQYLGLFVWEDLNGNGVHETTETILYKGSFDGLGGGINKLAVAGNGSDNFGITWCFGEQTLNGDGSVSCDGSWSQNNKAQTDKLLANMVLYAEQQRNNSDFKCSDLLTR